MTAWQAIETAPLNAPLEDYGPPLRLKLGDREVEGRYCGGLELGDIWLPPGWYADGEEIEPTHWRPADGEAATEDPKE